MPGDPQELMAQATKTIEDFVASQKKLHEEVKAMAEGSATDVKAAVTMSEGLAKKLEGFSNQLLDIEQKMADNVKNGKASVQTLGQMVIKSDAFKQYAQGQTNKMTFQANTIIGQEGSPAENSQTIVAPDRRPGIIPGAFRLLKIRDFLPQGTTNSNLVEYTRELSFTNNAAETNEGVKKPESALTFELASAPVRTIATFIKASKQVLDDAPSLASYIDTRLRYAVDYRIDYQLVNGNGTTPNISGMLDAGNFTTYTPLSGDTALDSINRAMYKVYEAEYAPTAILMNPADWGAIERLKTSQGEYLFGNPHGMVGPILWGLPVVVSNAIPVGKFIVANFDIAYQVWNRQGTVVEMFEQDEDNVQKNLVTIRSEGRLALATYRPAASYSGNLTT